MPPWGKPADKDAMRGVEIGCSARVFNDCESHVMGSLAWAGVVLGYEFSMIAALEILSARPATGPASASRYSSSGVFNVAPDRKKRSCGATHGKRLSRFSSIDAAYSRRKPALAGY